MGTVLVSSAIKDYGTVVSRYYMLNAAIPTEAFYSAEPEDSAMQVSEWEGYKPTLRASEWHTLFAGDDRSKLTWRDRFSNGQTRKIFNFFSPGEDVLSGAWRTQERVKGTLNLFGIYYGGWAFNFSDYDGREKPFDPEKTWPPERANAISEELLKIKPFFKKGGPIDELTVAGNIDGAIVDKYRNRVLAEAFPALTPAVGMTVNGGLMPIKNLDMQNDLKAKSKKGDVFWPREKEDWLHGDVREVAYSYIYPLFDQLTFLGGLKQ
jgi:hypothetical protein